MTPFNTFAELDSLVQSLQHRSADDDNITYDPFENTLQIRFNNIQERKRIDDEGKERDVYDRLLLRNVKSFDIEVPDDGKPHQIVKIEQVDAQTLRFVLTAARWLVRLDSAIAGDYGEAIDETDFEFSLSTNTMAIGLVAIVVIGLLLWLF